MRMLTWPVELRVALYSISSPQANRRDTQRAFDGLQALWTASQLARCWSESTQSLIWCPPSDLLCQTQACSVHLRKRCEKQSSAAWRVVMEVEAMAVEVTEVEGVEVMEVEGHQLRWHWFRWIRKQHLSSQNL